MSFIVCRGMGARSGQKRKGDEPAVFEVLPSIPGGIACRFVPVEHFEGLTFPR